jgi:hypothetical protein
MKDFLELMQEGEKLETNLRSRAKTIAHFDEKLSKFIELIANTNGYASHKRQFLLKEAESTSDFPTLFGTVLERSLLAKYNIAKPDWREYMKVGTQNDFRVANLLKTYGLQGNMPEVKERGEYKEQAMGDGKFSNRLKKYGKAFGLSWETMINDDLGAFADVSDRLNNAALRTEFFQATSLMAASTGPNATLFQVGGAHPIDGGAFTNKGTLTLNGVTGADNLGSTITAMRKQYDEDGEPIMIERFHLVVPPDMQLQALKVLSSAALIAVGVGNAAASQTSENIIAKLPITLHVNPYLPLIDTTHGTTTWYVFADPKTDGAAIQMNFLRGHETPELVQKMSDKISLGGAAVSPLEGDFDSDSMIWRVRHILGGTQLDPRFCYAQAATT